MPKAFVIETSQITAGIVIRERGGFRFYAAHPAMFRLEQTLHASPRAAQLAAERLSMPKRPQTLVF